MPPSNSSPPLLSSPPPACQDSCDSTCASRCNCKHSFSTRTSTQHSQKTKQSTRVSPAHMSLDSSCSTPGSSDAADERSTFSRRNKFRTRQTNWSSLGASKVLSAVLLTQCLCQYLNFVWKLAKTQTNFGFLGPQNVKT